MHKEYKQKIGYYFRNLFNFCKYIKENSYFKSLDNESKKTYTTLLRAQLSSYELLLLFYNSFGFEQYIIYIKEFNIFRDIKRLFPDLLDPDLHKDFLLDGRYGDIEEY